jgi:hypothetical protein
VLTESVKGIEGGKVSVQAAFKEAISGQLPLSGVDNREQEPAAAANLGSFVTIMVLFPIPYSD